MCHSLPESPSILRGIVLVSPQCSPLRVSPLILLYHLRILIRDAHSNPEERRDLYSRL